MIRIKILVISDTHGNENAVLEILARHDDAYMLIHLGDNYTDAFIYEKLYPEIRFEYVPGNCDFNLHDLEEWKVISKEEVKLFITHGKRYKEMLKKAVEFNCDIFISGHTHVPFIGKESEMTLLNPGSASLPRQNSEKSYAVIYIDHDKYKIFKEVL